MNLSSLLDNKDYLSLPETERSKVVEYYASSNEAFLNLPEEEQIKVLNHYVGYNKPIENVPETNLLPKEKSLATQAEESLNAAAFGIPVGTIGRSITHGIAKIPSELINLGSAIGGKAVEGVNSLIGDPSLNSGKNTVNDYINKSEAQYQQEVPDSFASNLGGFVGAVAPFAVGGLKSGLDRAYNFAQKPVEKMLSSSTSLASPLSHVAGGISSGAALTPFIGVGGESENYFTDKAKQLGINIGLGGMISGAIPAVRGTYNWLADSFAPAKDLLSKGGAENIANRYINSKLVNETTRPSIIADLNKSPAVIAGNEATVSQALANNPAGTQIQAHQNIVSQEPIASHKFGERIANQIELHKNMFNWAGTPDDITRLTELRTKAVAPLYKIVEKSNKSVSVKDTLDKLTNTIDKNIHNDAIANPLTSIKDKLLIKDKDGYIIGFERNPQRLKSLSDDISDMMKATSDNKPKYNLSVLREIKSSLDKEIGDVVPAYRKALDVFQKRSVPINQMEIGQHLKGKLTSISGKESPNDFINTLNNEKKLLKDTIGFGRTDIENILTPQQMGLVNKVTENLERNLASKNPLQKTNLRGGINVANETTISLPNLLSRPAMFTNYVMKSLGRSKEPEIDAYFAKLYLNPQELAKVLSKVPPTQRSAVNSRLQTFGRAYIANRTKENQ